jgi:hypothetical protein
LTAFGQRAVTGDLAVVVPVGADQISQHLGIPAVRLGPVGLDPGRNLPRLLGLGGHQGRQLFDPGQPIDDPPCRQHAAVLVQQAQVMVGLAPGSLLLVATRPLLGDRQGTAMVLSCVPDPQQVLVTVQWDGQAWQATATGPGKR